MLKLNYFSCSLLQCVLLLQIAAFVAYCKDPHAFDSTLDWKDEEERSRGIRRIAQVDLVPTISLLLGGNIPFSNLGRIIKVIFQMELSSLLTYHY